MNTPVRLGSRPGKHVRITLVVYICKALINLKLFGKVSQLASAVRYISFHKSSFIQQVAVILIEELEDIYQRIGWAPATVLWWCVKEKLPCD